MKSVLFIWNIFTISCRIIVLCKKSGNQPCPACRISSNQRGSGKSLCQPCRILHHIKKFGKQQWQRCRKMSCKQKSGKRAAATPYDTALRIAALPHHGSRLAMDHDSLRIATHRESLSAYTTASLFHLLPRYLRQKQTDRTAQSTTMAIHTPRTPMPINSPRNTPKNILNIHMEATPTTMVYITSPAALNTLGTVKDRGQMNTAGAQLTNISCPAIFAVS